jgi:hypothetical protein
MERSSYTADGEGSPEFSNIGSLNGTGTTSLQSLVCGALERSRGATRGPSERVSSPVTQELEACDASWRNEPRNAHGCQKPQRS